jgi:hypothetical protein
LLSVRRSALRLRSPLVVALLIALRASIASAQVDRLEIVSREPMDGGQPAGRAGPMRSCAAASTAPSIPPIRTTP